jgi:hypothetical protein
VQKNKYFGWQLNVGQNYREAQLGLLYRKTRKTDKFFGKIPIVLEEIILLNRHEA